MPSQSLKVQFESFAPFAFFQPVYLVNSSSFLRIVEDRTAENIDQFIAHFPLLYLLVLNAFFVTFSSAVSLLSVVVLKGATKTYPEQRQEIVPVNTTNLVPTKHLTVVARYKMSIQHLSQEGISCVSKVIFHTLVTYLLLFLFKKKSSGKSSPGLLK